MANFTAPADSFSSSASTEYLVTVMKEKTKDPIIFPTVKGLQAINIILYRKMNTLYVKNDKLGYSK